MNPSEVSGPTDPAATATGSAGPAGPRLLAALLAVAARRHTTALVVAVEPPLGVVGLSDLGAGVAILDREDGDAATLKQRLDRLLAAHVGGILHLVLVGGGSDDRTALAAADREAHDRNRLGVYHLDDQGHLHHVGGRRLGLIREAVKAMPGTRALEPGAIADAAERGRKAQEEATAFAATMESRPRHATKVLALACLVYFGLSRMWGKLDFDETLVRMGANYTPLVEAGQYWRLLSHAFLHSSNIHLLVNLVGLWTFGGFLEQLVGWRRFLVVYGASALAGGAASAFLRDSFSVGASGALWGLMGAGLALVISRQRVLPGLIASRLRPRLLSILVINIGLSFMPRIDFYAHFGGGLVGFALVASGLLTRGLSAPTSVDGVSRPPLDPLALRLVAAAVAAALAASVIIALLEGKPWIPTASRTPAEVI